MAEAAAPNPSAEPAGPNRLLSDGWLARRATQGDRRALEAIYRRYHQELYRFCLAMVGNPQDAQDTLQNTMVKVLRALPGEKRRIKLKPWLYRIARNEAVETLRKRRESVELEPEHATSVEIARTAEARERLRALMADLGELPDRQRGALVMRELSGLSFEQIGTAFETSPAVARQTVYEARLSLRQMDEGREMGCETVMRELSDGDGRITRRRQIRAHLRSCASCRAFRDSIAERRTNLAAIAPLPVAASLGLLHGVFASQASAATAAGATAGAGGTAAAGAAAGGGSVAGTVGAGAGKAIATSALVKSVATVAVVAAGVTAADQSGLIDVPLPGGSKATRGASESNPPPQHGSAATAGQHGETRGEGIATRGSRSKKAGGREEGRRGERRHDEALPHRSSRGTDSSKHRYGRDHGRSHAKRHERTAGLPAASQHGQETAAAHKSPSANPSPGAGPRSKGNGTPAHSSPPPTSSRPPKEESPEPAPAPPPESTEPAAKGGGNGSEKGSSGTHGEAPES